GGRWNLGPHFAVQEHLLCLNDNSVIWNYFADGIHTSIPQPDRSSASSRRDAHRNITRSSHLPPSACPPGDPASDLARCLVLCGLGSGECRDGCSTAEQ